MATSDMILARLREEQKQNNWRRSGQTWESTPMPQPTPRPAPAPVQGKPIATPRPQPTATPRPQPMPQGAPSPQPVPMGTPKPISAQPTSPMGTPTTQPVKPTPQGMPYQTYIPNVGTMRPMNQMPQAKPQGQWPMPQANQPSAPQGMQGPQPRGMVRGMIQPPRQANAPAMGAQDVLLKYLQETNDPELLARLGAMMEQPAWTENEQEMSISDGYAPGYQGMEYRTMGGRERLLDTLSRYYAANGAPKSNSWGR